MPTIDNHNDARRAYEAAISKAITEAFRKLLSERHLYQAEKIDDNAVRRSIPPLTTTLKTYLDEIGTFKLGASEYQWLLEGDEGLGTRKEDSRPGAAGILFTLPHVKLYCHHCRNREVFNVVSGNSTIKTWEYERPVSNGVERIEQVYELVYLCQHCRAFPEVFLVRREGGRLRLSGRSQIEHVDVPSVIPKDIERFYSGAMMAHQSGQTLAGNFLMRTACEQWVRKWAVPSDLAKEAFAKYMASLPDDFKEHFPSLSDIYAQLSADIHAATGSPELFEKMAADLVEHFDARRLRRLTAP